MSLLVGADGCRNGWVVVIMDTATFELTAGVLSTSQLVDSCFELIGIDIPIGLPEKGARECDLAARRLLGHPRASSVFPCPVRGAIRARDWEEACYLTSRIDGRRVTKQAFGIFKKIREVDQILAETPQLAKKILEVHPEVSFAKWGGGKPMAYGKKTLDGKLYRQALIAREFGEGKFEMLKSNLWGLGVGADDLADAFAALWSIRRHWSGVAKNLPAHPCFDRTGLPMNISF